MPETDEQKVQRYTECLMNGLDIKRALKRLFDLDVSADVFKKSDSYRFVKRYETSQEHSKYAIRVREKLRGLGIGIKRERPDETEDAQHGLKKPKREEPNTDELFAKAMGASSKPPSAPRAAVDYSKYKVTKRVAEVKVEPKKELIDEGFVGGECSSSSAVSSQELSARKPREYAPSIPTTMVKPPPRNHHPVPQSASLRFDESQFKPRKDRQKVFAGRRKKIGEEVPSLISMCQDVLASNVGMIEHVGIVPYELLKPALLNATVEQLRHIADCNPILDDDIDTHFYQLVQREFPKYADREKDGWTWREMYDKLVEKKHKKESAKLEMLTARIGNSQKSNDNGRKTISIEMAHTRVKSKSFFNTVRDSQVKMLSTPSAIQLSQARKHVKTEGKANLASITPRGGLGPSRSRQSSSNAVVVKKTAPLMAKCRKMLKR
uniref:Elongin-A n=1 Tax=Caenorhabditis japonica TaxID=281687 RepID=A0A8R1DW89_CAEJA